MAQAGIEPFYFGPSDKPLFGCYYAPQAELTRDCGVVLCHPMGQEYIRSHRSYRLLALRLATVGFRVLRFDFYGCGDSSGDFEHGQVHQWLRDISTAIEEIRGRSGIVKVCLVGLRLGGTLAIMAGAERDDIDGLVLWDPIVSGGDYIGELTAWHQEVLPDSHAKRKRLATGNTPTEILGFPLTDSLCTELENIDLGAIQQKPAPNILVIESNDEVRAGGVQEHLARIGIPVEYRHLPSPPIWLEIANRGLVPHQLLQSLVTWMSEVYP